MKTKIVSIGLILTIVFSLGFFFSNISHANAATLYFWSNGSDTNWATIGNWWTNADHAGGHEGTVPTGSDDVITVGTVGPNVNLDIWTSPASIDASATGITFTSASQQRFSGTLTGNATFNGSSYNYYGTINGAVTFNGSSYNSSGHITGDVTFNGSSYNSSGHITGDVTFNGSSYNSGTITGDVTFNNSSYNTGTVTGNADFYFPAGTGGTVTGTKTYHNYPVAHSFTGAAGDGDWANTANWIDGVIPTSSDDVYIFANVTASGEASVHSATFYDGAFLQNITLTVATNATFNDSSFINGGTITGDVTFNGSSYNQGTITGDVTFNGSSYNQGTITGTAKFTYATGGVITIPNGGQWGGGTATSIVGADDAPITSWIFNGSSVNQGTITGDVTFNGSSYNQGTITGDVTFYGDSTENYGSVSGTKTRYYNTVISPSPTRDLTGWTVIADGVQVDVSGAGYDGTTIFKIKNGGSFLPLSIVPIVIPSSPTITNISPSSGTTAGGTSITITGTEFASGAEVTIGGAPATNITIVNNTSITATTPAGTTGAANVVVTNTDTGTITSTGGFTYVAPAPTIVHQSSGGYLPGYGPRATLTTIPPTTPTVPPTTPSPNTCPNGKTLSSNCSTTLTTTPPVFTFTKTLFSKQSSPLVKILQAYLNAHGFPVATTGAGSPGQETTYFGPKTKSAVLAFQKAHNLVPDGIVGPITSGEMK